MKVIAIVGPFSMFRCQSGDMRIQHWRTITKDCAHCIIWLKAI